MKEPITYFLKEAACFWGFHNWKYSRRTLDLTHPSIQLTDGRKPLTDTYTVPYRCCQWCDAEQHHGMPSVNGTMCDWIDARGLAWTDED